MVVGSLFAGIGGFDLGFRRAGMTTAWFVESNAYRQAVLRRHWPGVPVYDDVCAVSGSGLAPVDVLAGGFPCQDLSAAGKGLGLDGPRSGLWREFARLIGEIRPRYVVVENVPLLRGRGLSRVLADLASCGYDAEWESLPASEFGAPHQRDRLWIVAYPNDAGRAEQRQRFPVSSQITPAERGAWWSTEPGVRRVDDGVPDRVDRLEALGDSLSPVIAEFIGRRIVSYEDVNA